MNRDQEAAGLDNLKNAGMEVVELTDEEKTAFQRSNSRCHLTKSVEESHPIL